MYIEASSESDMAASCGCRVGDEDMGSEST